MCCPIVQHYLIGRRFEFWLVWLISSVRAILAFTCKAKYQDWSLIYLLTTYKSNKYSPEDNSQRRLPMVCEIRPWRRWFVTLDKMYGKCKGWICRRSKSVYNSCSSILKTSKIFVFFQLCNWVLAYQLLLFFLLHLHIHKWWILQRQDIHQGISWIAQQGWLLSGLWLPVWSIPPARPPVPLLLLHSM